MGRFSADIPSRKFRVHIGSPNNEYESLREFHVRDGIATAPWDGLKAKSSDGKISVAATLPRAYQLRFDVINADSGRRVSDVAILYKEDKATWNGEDDYETGAHWSPYQIIENGKTTAYDLKVMCSGRGAGSQNSRDSILSQYARAHCSTTNLSRKAANSKCV